MNTLYLKNETNLFKTTEKKMVFYKYLRKDLKIFKGFQNPEIVFKTGLL